MAFQAVLRGKCPQARASFQIERENDIAIQKRGFHENYRFENSVCKVMEMPILTMILGQV